MAATIISSNDKEITLQVTIPCYNSMLEFENAIQDSLNQCGVAATGIALERFDTDGSPIIMGTTKLTSKGKVNKVYQSPYGEVVTERYIYQSSEGGRGYCPLENAARIIGTSTPKFAKSLAHK